MQVLRSKYGVKIGSSTGYTSEIMEKLRPQAASEGYAPDCYVTSDLVPNARPSPAMIFKNMIQLDIWSPKSVVKVDDTTGGIKAGLYGGMKMKNFRPKCNLGPFHFCICLGSLVKSFLFHFRLLDCGNCQNWKLCWID